MNIAPLDSLIDLEIYFQRKYKTNNENDRLYNTNVVKELQNLYKQAKVGVNYLKYYGEKIVNRRTRDKLNEDNADETFTT
jgi:hypothetical protein